MYVEGRIATFSVVGYHLLGFGIGRPDVLYFFSLVGLCLYCHTADKQDEHGDKCLFHCRRLYSLSGAKVRKKTVIRAGKRKKIWVNWNYFCIFAVETNTQTYEYCYLHPYI